mgnify:CR=1 FL=1
MDDDLLGGLDGAGALCSGGVLARQCGAGLSGLCSGRGWPLRRQSPSCWAGWWLWAEKAPPLTEEELMAKPGRIHIVTEEALL